jgi:hypothetical protein
MAYRPIMNHKFSAIGPREKILTRQPRGARITSVGRENLFGAERGRRVNLENYAGFVSHAGEVNHRFLR